MAKAFVGGINKNAAASAALYKHVWCCPYITLKGVSVSFSARSGCYVHVANALHSPDGLKFHYFDEDVFLHHIYA